MKSLPLALSATVAIILVPLLLWDKLFAGGDENTPEAGQTTGKVDQPTSTEEQQTPQQKTPSTPPRPTPPKHDYYSEKAPSPGGIGKFYQGREISQVMGHLGIKWLERKNREAEEAPSRAIGMIKLADNETLVDIGAGSGYYATRIALKYPKAKVIGVDIQPEMIRFLERRAKQLDLKNLSTNLGTITSLNLPAESVDAALLVDAYHEFSHPYEMMTSLVSALKPGGRLYLLEYRAKDPDVPIKRLHKMTQDQAKKEMKLAGLTWEKTLDDLPWQHFMVFRKPR